MSLTRDAVLERPSDPVEAGEPFVLLDDNLSPHGSAYLFEDPVEILRCDRPEQVEGALAQVRRCIRFAAQHLQYVARFQRRTDLRPSPRRLTRGCASSGDRPGQCGRGG